MFADNLPIPYNPAIDFVGYNISENELLNEKIYYRRCAESVIDTYHPLIETLSTMDSDIYCISFCENCAEKSNRPIYKYDFKVETKEAWTKVIDYIGSQNIPFFDKEMLLNWESLPWFPYRGYILGFKIDADTEELLSLQMYYKPTYTADFYADICAKNKLPSLPDRLVHTAQLHYDFMKNYVANGYYPSILAVDFLPDNQLFKVYYYKEDAIEARNDVPLLFAGLPELEEANRILDYADVSKLRFVGFALATSIIAANKRFNLYFKQQENEA